MLDINAKAKALIFDLDGTVADTMPVHFQAWVNVLKEYEVNFTKDIFFEFTGIPTINIVPLINERLNTNLDPAEIARKKEEYCMKNLDKVGLIKPVATLIYKYYGKMPLSLGTGSTRRVTEVILKALGLDKYFDIYITADDVVNHKPAPDTFLKCAELMGMLPEVCEVFEDGELGLKAAKCAGMIVTDIRPYL